MHGMIPAKAKRLAIDAAAVILAASAVVAYFHFKPEPAPAGVHIEAKVSPDVKGVEQHDLPVEHVRVYAPKAKAALHLPPAAADNPKVHVVAATKTPNDERAHTVTTTLDSETGKFTTYDRAEPLPWMAVSTKTEIGAYLGFKGTEPAMRIDAHQEFLQVKAVHVGIVGSVDISQSIGVDTFVGAGAWVRW
jgi:hypothetical protein